MELHRIFNQRVGSDNELRLAALRTGERCLAFPAALAADDEFDAIACRRKNPPRREVVLRGQDFRRSHQRHLAAVFDDDGRGFERHDCFAAADVAFEQPVHREALLQVRSDLAEHALLRRRRLERQDTLQSFANPVLANAHGDAALAMILLAAQRQRQLIIEELLEDQPHLRRAAKAVELLEAFILRREMGVEQRFAACGEAVARTDLVRQCVGQLAIEIQQDVVNDAAQHAGADPAHRLVDRNDAADFRRVSGSIFVRAQQFNLRVDHFEAARTIRIHVHLSVQHKALARLEFPREIRAVKEPRVELPRAIAYCDVKYWAAAVRESDRSARLGHFHEQSVYLPRHSFSNGCKTDAIFVSKW